MGETHDAVNEGDLGKVAPLEIIEQGLRATDIRECGGQRLETEFGVYVLPLLRVGEVGPI